MTGICGGAMLMSAGSHGQAHGGNGWAGCSPTRSPAVAATTSAIFGCRYSGEHPGVGEWLIEDELKRVWDDVPDDVFSWTAAAANSRSEIPQVR